MRLILLVLDALGIGAMPDVPAVRPQDVGANTLASLVRSVGGLDLDNLRKLGLGQIAPLGSPDCPASDPLASYGRSRLAHQGADSYLGHQEIMGTIPKPPVATLMSQAASRLSWIPELVEHEETGLLITPADAVGLADALERLARDAGLRRRLAAAGRAKVQHAFNLNTNAASLVEAFQLEE